MAQDRPVVDYSTMPLGFVKSRLPACARPELIDDVLAVPTLEAAEASGYGRIDALVAQNNAALAGRPSSSPPSCSQAEEEVSSAYSQALSLYLGSGSAREVYDDWAACMSKSGFKGLSNPSDRSVVLSKELFPSTDTGSVDQLNARAERLRSKEIALAKADVGCQYLELAPRAGKLADAQRKVLESAPKNVAELLGR